MRVANLEGGGKAASNTAVHLSTKILGCKVCSRPQDLCLNYNSRSQQVFGGYFVPQGDTGNIWRYFWLSQQGVATGI